MPEKLNSEIELLNDLSRALPKSEVAFAVWSKVAFAFRPSLSGRFLQELAPRELLE